MRQEVLKGSNMFEIRYEPELYQSSAYDGDQNIGVCQYRALPEKWVIYHTYTDPAYGGQGIAGKLVECVIDQANANGVELDSTCSYAKKILNG